MTVTTMDDSPLNGAQRDRAIDGFRGVAVAGVVFGHAVAYRFADVGGPLAFVRRFAGPASETGVQLFFVISGFIITHLLLREQARTGAVGIAAFYARRLCRIMPPFLAYLAALVVLGWLGRIAMAPVDVLPALAFTCNTGLTECDWWIAHSWSLAVEEQYYLGWPLLFAVLPAAWRVRFLVALLLLLAVAFMRRAPEWHGNAASFACIAIGALYALSEQLRRWIGMMTHPLAWAMVCAMLMIAPFTPVARTVAFLAPILTLYVLFAGRALPAVRAVLESAPLQLLGLASYSLYLWQQLFLARPQDYPGGPLPLVALPLLVVASVLLIERPTIRLGHRLSRWVGRRPHPMIATHGDAS